MVETGRDRARRGRGDDVARALHGRQGRLLRGRQLPQRTRYIPVVVAADRLAEDIGVTRGDGRRGPGLPAAHGRRRGQLGKSRIPLNGRTRKSRRAPRPRAESLATSAGVRTLGEQYAEALGGRAIDHRHTVAHAPPMCDGAALASSSARRTAPARGSSPMPRRAAIRGLADGRLQRPGPRAGARRTCRSPTWTGSSSWRPSRSPSSSSCATGRSTRPGSTSAAATWPRATRWARPARSCCPGCSMRSTPPRVATASSSRLARPGVGSAMVVERVG